MKSKKKKVAGIILFLLLTLLVVGDLRSIASHPDRSLALFLMASIVNYHIIAFLFGWVMPMLTYSGGLVKGRHDTLRVIMFLFFICFWIFLFKFAWS
mgnify:CR=1 FL=1|tara:strand:- start:455 stop:745 length:291 start_codon:yes stop_codon:yes gene_type:complete